MLLADAIDVVKALTVPIGIGLAILVILLVPSLRKSILDSFTQGKEAGERQRGQNRPGEEQDQK